MKLKKLTAIITMLGLSALALSACSGTTQAAAPAEAAAVESTVESTATTEMEPAEEAAQPTDESAVAEALKEEVAADSMYVLHQERVASPEWVTKLPAAQDENVKQLFVVAGLGMDKTTASISMHERSEDGRASLERTGSAWMQTTKKAAARHRSAFTSSTRLSVLPLTRAVRFRTSR